MIHTNNKILSLIDLIIIIEYGMSKCRFFSLCQTQYLPVAQLDNASDSDSEDHEFESRRADQNPPLSPEED